MKTELTDLAFRVRALEAANRRLRRLVAAASAALLVPALLAARPADPTLAAERFVLRGPGGETRGVWRSADGAAELSLLDGEGRERIALAVAADGRPTLDLRDARGGLRVRLLLTRESSLNFYDSGARLRAALGVTSYGPTPIRPYGQNQRLAPGAADDFFGGAWAPERPAATPSSPGAQDGPVFKLYDSGGKPRLEARVDGREAFIFFHTPGDAIHAVTTTEHPGNP